VAFLPGPPLDGAVATAEVDFSWDEEKFAVFSALAFRSQPWRVWQHSGRRSLREYLWKRGIAGVVWELPFLIALEFPEDGTSFLTPEPPDELVVLAQIAALCLFIQRPRRDEKLKVL
jgi:hypothetical protein